MIYMFCYDIGNPKRLTKIAKQLENHGIRIQKSFFQCDIDFANKEKLKEILLSLMEKKEDSLIIYPLCETCAISAEKIGKGDIINLEPFEIL